MKTDTLTEKKKPTRQDLCRPVSFDQAEAILRVYYPRYAYTKNQLRRMAKNRLIPFMRQARCGMIRRNTYTVRVLDLLKAFAKMSVTVLDSDGSVVSANDIEFALPQAGDMD